MGACRSERAKVTTAVREQRLRGHLGSFGIKGALATQPMRALSGGQAVRVGLAAVAFTSPHLLVLVCSGPSDMPIIRRMHLSPPA